MDKAQLYDAFQKGLTGVNGQPHIAKKADAAAELVKIFQEKGTKEVAVVETPFLKELGVVDALKAAGIKVDTDHIRKNAPNDEGGVTDFDYGVANLGSVVQFGDNIDKRIVATVAATFVGFLPLSKMLPNYDDMIDIFCETKPFPKFAGFITGPSRTADIECVGTVGVHGPLDYSVIVVEDA